MPRSTRATSTPAPVTTNSTFEPALEVKKIKPHPANPRHQAIADDEMVASIKSQGLIQPIVVAPAQDADTWVVIAGHRRLDGMKKARKRTTPAIVRNDLTTDAQQIEAAVVENVHRVDLSPMEEAEAFEQLRGLKLTQKEISTKTGRPVSTIRDRLKLLKLSKKTRDSIHTGQLTIGDALEIVSFEDDPKAQTALVKAAGGTNFKYELETQRRLREKRIRNEKIVEVLTKDGVDEFDLNGQDVWAAQRDNDELRYLGGFSEVSYDSTRGEHKTCLAYALEKDYGGGHRITLLCTSNSTHKAKLSKEEREREQAAAERTAMWEREREEKAIAKALRCRTIVELVPEGAMIPDFLVDQLRVVVPPSAAWVFGELGDQPDLFFDIAGTSEAARFRFGLYDDEEDAKHVAFIESYNAMPGWLLVRLLMVVMFELADNQTDDDLVGATFATRYYGFLEQLGHTFTGLEVESRERAAATLAPVPETDEVAGSDEDVAS